MGNKRYTINEKKSNSEGNNNDGNFDHACGDRGNSINGFRKLLILILVFVFIYYFRMYVVDRVIISGSSMDPTYSNEDVVWARKFNISDLRRYKIVLAKLQNKFIVKRIIGLPNETVQIINGYVYINGEILEDDYGDVTQVYGCAVNEVKLGEDEYFLMGDNRDNSMDSRAWGAVNINRIKGIVIFQVFPFWEMGFVD